MDAYATLRPFKDLPCPDDDDLVSVEAFRDYAERTGAKTFLPGDAQRIARATEMTVRAVMEALRAAGLRVTTNASRANVRGYTAWDHNLFAGNPGSGGTGWEQISGFAGKAG